MQCVQCLARVEVVEEFAVEAGALATPGLGVYKDKERLGAGLQHSTL